MSEKAINRLKVVLADDNLGSARLAEKLRKNEVQPIFTNFVEIADSLNETHKTIQ